MTKLEDHVERFFLTPFCTRLSGSVSLCVLSFSRTPQTLKSAPHFAHELFLLCVFQSVEDALYLRKSLSTVHSTSTAVPLFPDSSLLPAPFSLCLPGSDKAFNFRLCIQQSFRSLSLQLPKRFTERNENKVQCHLPFLHGKAGAKFSASALAKIQSRN